VSTINSKILNANCWDVLEETPDGFYDAIITDPEYDCNINVNELCRVCKGNIIVFCKPENQFFKPDEYLFWVKAQSTKNYINNCGRFVEMILVLRKGKIFNRLHWSQMIGVYDDKLIYPPEHPWQKPLSLIERLVRIYTNPDSCVLDPFFGSGQVGIACKNLGRCYVGIEQDKEYFELAQRNLGKTCVTYYWCEECGLPEEEKCNLGDT